MTITEVFLLYVCPSLGGIMSTTMFAAPINDLRDALSICNLGDLNPFPFAMMTGNTLGWLIYGYFQRDPFLIASNLPGFILSLWLNMGTAKIQYAQLREGQKTSVAERNQIMQRWDADRVADHDDNTETANNTSNVNNSLRAGGEAGLMRRRIPRRQQQQQPEDAAALLLQETSIAAADNELLIMTPQEALMLRVLIFWAVLLTYTSWLYPSSRDPSNLIGIIVNLQLVVFYGAPLKTIGQVFSERTSASIHYESMILTLCNTSFWVAYGCARRDSVIVIPNASGLLLGVVQGVLCLLYPRQPPSEEGGGAGEARLSLRELESELIQNEQQQQQQQQQNPEEAVPSAAASASTGGEEKQPGDANPEVA